MTRRASTNKAKVLKAQKALGELTLSVTTQADKARIFAAELGLLVLDEEQADIKSSIDDLLAALKTGFTECELIEELRAMSRKWEAER